MGDRTGTMKNLARLNKVEEYPDVPPPHMNRQQRREWAKTHVHRTARGHKGRGAEVRRARSRVGNTLNERRQAQFKARKKTEREAMGLEVVEAPDLLWTPDKESVSDA